MERIVRPVRATKSGRAWRRIGAAGVAAMLLAGPALADGGEAEALAERMLGAVGGRAAWSGLTSLVNDSRQHRLDPPAAVRAVISLDLRQPRFRIETSAPDLHLIRVVDGERSWRLDRAGQLEPLPQAAREEDLRWYAGHVYRTLHRIARRDAALRLAVGDGGRLEVFEGAQRIAWYRLDAQGQPYAFGGFNDETGSLCGPWSFESGGIRHPVWVSRPDGSWRAQIVSLATNVPLDAALFEQPDRMVSLGTLRGDWRGEGTLAGRPTSVRLSWQPALLSGFTRLTVDYSDATGATRFSGEALYRAAERGLEADWFDSTGNRYGVVARYDGPCLRADWGAAPASPTGRSSYCMGGDSSLAVVDELRTPSGEWRSFGRYELQRVD